MLSQLIRMTLFWVVTIYLSAISQPIAAHAFPSLFRPRLFQPQRVNNNNQQQQQQQMPQHQPEPILLASNSLQPVAFDPFGLRPSMAHTMTERHTMHPSQQHHHHQRHHRIMSSEHHFDPAQAAYFSPSISHSSIPLPVDHHHQSSQLSGVHPMASFQEPASLTLETSNNQNNNNNNGNNVESTVDKIENHIGSQIEQSLKAGEHHHQSNAAASEYHQPSGGSGSETGESHKSHHQKMSVAEKESAAAASGEEPEEVEEPVAEKRHEKHHEEEAQHHHEHKEKPLEAFEVHHKKGGKSFQYFHQGHSHP